MEAELKLALPSRAALDALLEHLGASDRKGILQSSIFYDTPSETIRGEGCNARLRHALHRDNGTESWVVTVKGPKLKQKEFKADSIAVRPEEEEEVTKSVADAIRAGTMSPLDALPQTELIKSIKAACGQEALRPREMFENTRVPVKHTLQTSKGVCELTLELDETRFEFEGAREAHWECEVELPPERASELAGPVQAALQEMLHSVCKAQCEPAPGKLSRYRKFVKRAKKSSL
uniref:CYTH domain-containing protein n=1 Tax=Chrysotila carterae TaxID=13221 RepID=A0A7S4F281_CHRCT|mmetsp:Transcript_18112/g.39050  ORF Transcript_18112/g.39050 Transcript_18112/m.39050 type:complete len:234 (-) Transcript_18112:1074-1775(-)